MRFFKYNRAVAWAVLCVTVAFSLVFGVYRSVSQLESKAERIYSVESAQYGCAQSDISKLIGYGRELYAIHQSVLGENASLRDALSALDQAKSSPIRQDILARTLQQEAALSYNQLILCDSLTEQQKNSVTSYYYEINSTMQRLAGNRDYAKIAAQYNRACTSFPGSLLGKEPAATYN